MRPTVRLYDAVRITLFTRPNCGLCDTAKTVLASLRERRPFSYREVDLGKADAKGWRDLYDFDVPVVRVPLCFSALAWAGVLSPGGKEGFLTWAVAHSLLDPRQQGLRAGGRPEHGRPRGEAYAQVHGG